MASNQADQTSILRLKVTAKRVLSGSVFLFSTITQPWSSYAQHLFLTSKKYIVKNMKMSFTYFYKLMFVLELKESSLWWFILGRALFGCVVISCNASHCVLEGCGAVKRFINVVYDLVSTKEKYLPDDQYCNKLCLYLLW